ncbi:MAG TPA: dienelactone hydrolase family protein [Actinomycetota bacterium]|jgi:carboxymethylenebutenolidase|nr:dienelactone hydrolase family protein [Actinomycetota bacterium]
MTDHEGFYLAEPSGPGRAGVLVLHDWYGLLAHVRTACDELAAAGLVALAPDLYDGRSTTDPEQAEALMEALEDAKTQARLDAATADLRERTGGGPVGGLGFSMGGFRTLLQATTGAYDAIAVYYAALDEEQAPSIRCPVLLHLAEHDEFDPPELYERFVAALRAAGTQVEARTWPGTEHSFANADVALYAPKPAAEAWSITVQFLRDHLGSP